MTDHDVEETLRAGYREMVEREAPGALRASVSHIPDLVPASSTAGRLGRLLPFAMAATAVGLSAMIVIGLVVSSLPNVGPPSGSSPSRTSEASVATTEPTSQPGVVPAEFLSILRFFTVDYESHHSPQDLRDDSDLVVVGRFVAVTEGREMPYGRVTTHATFTVEVDRILAGSADNVVDGQVFLELQTPARGAADDLREVLPTGRVLLFLGDRSDVEGIGPTGAPDGAPIFALASPMGSILEDGNRLVGIYLDLDNEAPAWSEQTSFDEFVAAMGG